jgi:tetratricopeptide repeat protein 21B
VEQPDNILEQRQLAARICHQIAEHAVIQRNFDGAIQQYKEALTFYPEDEVNSE